MLEPPYCVGRDAEIAHAQALLHDAMLGSGSGLILRGQRGVGKSRFLRECASIRAAASKMEFRCATPWTFSDAKSSSPAALLSAVLSRSKRRPVAVLIDDLHRASPGELQIVDALLAMTVHQRVVVIACAHDDLDWAPSRFSGSADMRELRPLDDAAMELLICNLARANSQSLANEEIREMVRTAQGNPRFGVELVDCMLQAGNDANLVPKSALERIAALRNTISRTDFEILSACSAIGESFREEWVAAVSDRPASAVADALQNASELGVLEESRRMPGWLAFRQIAVRKALYDSLISLKRRILHDRIVACLRGVDGDPELSELAGSHWAILENHANAAESFKRAADAHFAASEFAAAADMYAKAANHLDKGTADWKNVQSHLVHCLDRRSEWIRLIPAAESLMEALDDGEREAAIKLMGELCLAHLNNGDLDAAEATVQRVLALDLPEAAAHGQTLTAVVAYAMYYSGYIEKAARLLSTIDPKTITDATALLRYNVANVEIHALHRPLENSFALIDQAAEVAPSLRGVTHCWTVGAELASRFGDVGKAREYVRRAKAMADNYPGQMSDYKVHFLKEQVRCSLLEGDLHGAREMIQTVVRLRESGRRNDAFYAGAGVFVGLRVGDLALVDACFDPNLLANSVAAQDAEWIGMLLPGFAEAFQVRGMSEDLIALLRRCIEARLVDPYAAIQLCATRYGAIECADQAVEQVEIRFGDALGPAASAHVALIKGTALRRQGKRASASEFASNAAQQFRRMGWRLYEAAALELAGDVSGAMRIYERCGACIDASRLASSASRKVKRAPFGARLTPRELEVARLVSRKWSNEDIARALEISVRTVHHHVESAFSKLGVRARWQLTEVMLEKISLR